MRISALEEYGLRCLVALARSEPHRQVSIAEIAEAEGLSVPYASKLLSILRRANLVTAVRGRGGGFVLARKAHEMSLLDILTALGGPLFDPDHCNRYTGQLDACVHTGDCSVHDVLHGLAGYLQEFLQKTTLQDVIDRGNIERDTMSGLKVIATGLPVADSADRSTGNDSKRNIADAK